MITGKNIRFLMITASAVVLLVVSAGVVRWYINNYHIPMRQARPLLDRLASEDPQEIQKVAFLLMGLQPMVTAEGEVRMKNRKNDEIKEHHPLGGIAAKRVERKILELLPKIEDQVALDRVLHVITPTPSAGLDFSRYGEEEWRIISAAADRHDPSKFSGRFWKVEYLDGRPVLAMGFRPR
jgi:hypothetical protein